MNLVSAIQQRRSIRAFKPDPVPGRVLTEIMEIALRAPSWANTQPWEFAIVGGDKLEEIRRAFLAKAEEPAKPDLPGPREFPEPFKNRLGALAKKVTQAIGKAGTEGRQGMWWHLQGLRLYDAPAVIYIYTDRSFCFQSHSLNLWPIFDCGLVAQNIMLLATSYGLGTIAQMQAVHYPDLLRELLGIPESKLILLGIAVGYPDWSDPMNGVRSEREALENVTRWHGFE